MKAKRNRGFTFIELVIGVSLSFVIFVILLAAMRLAYRSQEKGTERAEISQRIRILSDRIAWLIRGIYPYSISKPEGSVLYFSGRGDSAGFITTSVDHSGKPEDRGGLKWVQIFVDRDGLKFKEKVFFSEDVFDEEGGSVYLFDPAVKKIAFEFFDIDEEKDTKEWVTEWDPKEKKYPPSAVKVKLMFIYKGRDIWMPELIAKIRTIKK